MAELYHTIYCGKQVNPDLAVAVFLLREMGDTRYPGINQARVKALELLPGDKNGWLLEEEGILSFNFDDAKFPESAELSLTRQVINDLKINLEDNPVLRELVKIAEDREDKGSYNFYEILKNLIREYQEKIEKSFAAAKPILKAHEHSLEDKLNRLPTEYMRALNAGRVHAFMVNHKGRNLRIILVESDEGELACFLHNHPEIRADIVGQKFTSNYVNLTTRYKLEVDLTDVAAVLRLDEIRKKKIPFDQINWKDLRLPGIVAGAEEWFYDEEFLGVFNARLSKRVKPTALDIPDLKKALMIGLDLNTYDARCAKNSCREKKCRYYFYDFLRCRKVRMNIAKENSRKRKVELKKNIKILRPKDAVKIKK